MAILQVRDIDDGLYEALKNLAKKERRSISQEVIMMIESYLSNPKRTALDATEEFLNLSWNGNESADEIINHIRMQRKNSSRFGNQNDLFN
jgi:plasmid stability protein